MGTRLRTSIGLGCAALALGLAAAPAAAGVRASSSDFSAASALVRGAASGNAIRVGIATDEIRSMAPADYFGALRDVGMTAHREVIGWDPSNPTTIPDRDLLRRAVDAAAARGVEVVFAVTSTTQNGMGANPGALSAPGAAGAFANFVQIVARTYP